LYGVQEIQMAGTGVRGTSSPPSVYSGYLYNYISIDQGHNIGSRPVIPFNKHV